jgi:CheY-like chemotaxis protein
MDLHLRDIDGLTVLKLMKKHERLRSVPVVIATANAHWNMLAIALEAGTEAYLFKPLEEPLLSAVLSRAVGTPSAPPGAAPKR